MHVIWQFKEGLRLTQALSWRQVSVYDENIRSIIHVFITLRGLCKSLRNQRLERDLWDVLDCRPEDIHYFPAFSCR